MQLYPLEHAETIFLKKFVLAAFQIKGKEGFACAR